MREDDLPAAIGFARLEYSSLSMQPVHLFSIVFRESEYLGLVYEP